MDNKNWTLEVLYTNGTKEIHTLTPESGEKLDTLLELGLPRNPAGMSNGLWFILTGIGKTTIVIRFEYMMSLQLTPPFTLDNARK